MHSINEKGARTHLYNLRLCTWCRLAFPSVTRIVDSGQAPLRHTQVSAYRCFLPDLTGFTGLRCARPNCHRHLYGADPTKTSLDQGFNPAAADCRYRAPLPPRLAQPKFAQCLLTVLLTYYTQYTLPYQLISFSGMQVFCTRHGMRKNDKKRKHFMNL